MPLPAKLAFLVACAAMVTFTACGGHTVGPSGAGGSTTSNPFPCNGSQPDLVMGQPSGYEHCANGMVHRPAAITCPSGLPRAQTCSTGFSDKCSKDSDCTGGLHDYCGQRLLPPDGSFCGCFQGCVSDAECGSGAICVCGDPVGLCVPATCKSDADCGPGLVCAEYAVGVVGCGGSTYFACQTPEDTCAVDTMCQSSGGICTYDGTKRACMQTVCTI